MPGDRQWTKVPTSTAICVIGFFILIVLYAGFGPPSQRWNLDLIDDWRARSELSRQELIERWPELAQIRLFGFTGGQGMVGVAIVGCYTPQALLAYHDWLLAAQPPRPIWYRRSYQLCSAVELVGDIWQPGPGAEVLGQVGQE
jgi:hypothetical protein